MLPLLLAALLLVYSTKHAACRPLRRDERGTSSQENLQVSRESWFSRALHYMVSNPETLEELMNKKYAVLEGDMVLPSDRNAVQSIWPTREVPYVIGDDVASRTDDILSALAMVSEHTCVSFHRRSSETNYLLFVSSNGCASYVGFIGGEQPLFIGPPCIVGNIVHELLHALGFHHEHTRADRGQYVSVLSHNIMEGMEGNFEKQSGETFDLRYDISSILHYGSGFFSANGLPTIVSKGDVGDMGQRRRMTETDIQRVRRLYSCDSPRKEAQTEISVEKKEEDAHVHMLVHDAASTEDAKVKGQNPAEKPEGQTALLPPCSDCRPPAEGAATQQSHNKQ